MEELELDLLMANGCYYNGSCGNLSGSNWRDGAGDNGTAKINSFYFYETEQFTVLGILLLIIIVGNGGVLRALLGNKSRKSRMNFFICHLAVSDLGVGLINVLTDIIWKLTISWEAGNAACKIIRFLQVVVTYASSYVLVALSIDRYDAIRHPMKFSGSWKRAKCLIIAAWLLSIIFATPILILYEERTIQGQLQCWIELESALQWQIYMVVVSLTVFILPAIIITGCYAVIIATIWSKSAVIAVTKQNAKSYLNADNTKRMSSRGLIPRAKVKTVKITLVIVSVFIMCWSPYIIFDLLQVFNFVPPSQTNTAIATFVQSLAPLNSAANPIIYCLFSSQFLRTLMTLPPLKWLRGIDRQRRSEETAASAASQTQTSSLSEYLTNSTGNPRKNGKSSSINRSASPNRIHMVSFYVEQ